MKVEVNTVLELTEEEQGCLLGLQEKLNERFPESPTRNLEELVNSVIDFFLVDHIKANVEMLLEEPDEQH